MHSFPPTGSRYSLTIASRNAIRGPRPYVAGMEPSPRKLAGIAIILAIIALWATFVVSLARVVGTWPVLVQAPYYLFVGLIWILPLKPLVRWMQTGSFRADR